MQCSSNGNTTCMWNKCTDDFGMKGFKKLCFLIQVWTCLVTEERIVKDCAETLSVRG